MNWGELVYYDETSLTCLRWKVDRWRGEGDKRYIFRKAGDVAGNIRKLRRGRYFHEMMALCLIVDGKSKSFYVHRIVYELTVGKIPENLQIDHIDGNPLNNVRTNLRAVEGKINSRNKKKSRRNKSGVTGVSLNVDHMGVERYWAAHWRELDGKLKLVYFSIARLGYDKAFQQACSLRAQKIKELNMQGAGYTDDHGARE